jgi:ribosomal protein L11 methyltransferase
MDHGRLKARAPYDLLDRQYPRRAADRAGARVGAALAPGGRLILAGLLDHQAAEVAAAYRREGLMLSFTIPRGEWPTLVMRKRRAISRRR